MGAATIEPPVSRARRKHPDLIFEWIGGRGHRWRLLLFLNLSLALHVACFYAFQVVYPQTVKQRAETTEVTYLDPRDDPAVRDVIARIEDRAVYFDGSLRLPIPGASLENEERNEVLPEPGFASHEPSLKSPPPVELSGGLPRLFAGDGVFFPPRARLLPEGAIPPALAPFDATYVYRPQLVPSGAVVKRKALAMPDWSDSQQVLAEAVGNSILFLVEIDTRGAVSSCLPWKGVENSFDAAMARKIEAEASYEPADAPSQGWLEMRW